MDPLVELERLFEELWDSFDPEDSFDTTAFYDRLLRIMAHIRPFLPEPE